MRLSGSLSKDSTLAYPPGRQVYLVLHKSAPWLTRRTRGRGDTEPARMEVRNGTNDQPRSELLLHGEGACLCLEHVQ